MTWDALYGRRLQILRREVAMQWDPFARDIYRWVFPTGFHPNPSPWVKRAAFALGYTDTISLSEFPRPFRVEYNHDTRLIPMWLR